jgi:hypothetical protein
MLNAAIKGKREAHSTALPKLKRRRLMPERDNHKAVVASPRLEAKMEDNSR